MLPYKSIRITGSTEIEAGNLHRLTAAATSCIQSGWRKVAAPVRAWKFALSGIVILSVAGGLAEAQGPLAPTSGPAPMMKSVDELEPRTPIDAINTPGDANSTFRITQPGQYYLTAPLTGEIFKRGISIAASDVTIDLMGFPVLGISGATTGIATEGPFSRITIRNGIVADWPSDGINLANGGLGTGALIEHVHILNNGQRGLLPNPQAVVRHCLIFNNDNAGVFGADQTAIEQSVSRFNRGIGFRVGAESRLLDVIANLNTGHGFDIGSRSIVRYATANWQENVGFTVAANTQISASIAQLNMGEGFRMTGRGNSLRDSMALFNTNTAVNAIGADTLLEGNLVAANYVDGIRVSGADSTVIHNHVIDNLGNGVVVSGATGVILHGNTSGGNDGLNWSLAAGQKAGPIIVPDANPAIVAGNNVGVPLGTTDPWANFTLEP